MILIHLPAAQLACVRAGKRSLLQDDIVDTAAVRLHAVKILNDIDDLLIVVG